MKWRNHGFNVAISDCGCYEVRTSVDRYRGEFFNAWYLPTGKHIDAGHKKAPVVAACELHAQRAIAEATA